MTREGADVDHDLTVIARAPFELYYEGPARAVTSRNKIGKFDILPGHADFFSMLEPGELIIQTPNDELHISLDSGILTARNNKVMIFINM
jgi:F0F1-type ATP synthase epsilon subunit